MERQLAMNMLALLQQFRSKKSSTSNHREPPSEGEESGPNSTQSPNSRAKTDTGPQPSSMSSADTYSVRRHLITPETLELVNIVRKDLAMALKALLQHGLVRACVFFSVFDNRLISSKSLVACIVPTNKVISSQANACFGSCLMNITEWKHGKEYKLHSRQAVVGGVWVSRCTQQTSSTAKQTLLRTLHRIKTTHEPCRRSMDAMFKSLVCAGINQKRLIYWCRLITKSSSLVEEHYQSWAYVLKTGMDEALEHLERLNEYNFHIPEDLAIRHLTKINDAFGDT
ncbi:Rab GTPase binding [Desmophyllum pertusum]|uniref:Rab GTPase binding n=1 Tax=Desmophyllum pertusum TaxID=174260 RepID=A0A9W9ZGB0_9CNID|nr:Rab GTPase binding [Desmophyllum pertusum]